MLGGRTVRELLAVIDSEELSEWQAYFRIVGPPHPWHMAGTIAAEVRNGFRTKGRAAQPIDFIPIRRPSRRQSPDEMRSAVRGVAALMEAQSANRPPEIR